MSSYTDMYVSNLVDSVLQKLYYEDHNVSFFKHYNTFSIPLKAVNNSMLKSGNIVQILYHDFQPGVIKTAYNPMMDWVNALYGRYYANEMSFETFLQNAGVYSLHQQVYMSYREKVSASESKKSFRWKTIMNTINFSKDLSVFSITCPGRFRC